MRLLQIFNQYRSLFNGEENVVLRTAELVERHGGVCRVLIRSSRQVRGWSGRISAFFSGFYNRRAAQEVVRVVSEFQPDVVHAHNLLPLFSPSVLVACCRAGVPVVFTAHNQALTCPRADHLRRGRLCDQCLGGYEYHCVLHNCRGNLCESIAYAARSAFARRMRFYHDYVHVIIALTEFARQRLLRQGFDSQQVVVLPNMAPVADEPSDAAKGGYVLFAGRLSAEKGIDVLLAAACALPDVRFLLAGSGPLEEKIRNSCPANVQLLGQVASEELTRLYRGARLVVLPSLTYEMCPLVIGEAMGHGLPVVASCIGGIPELVDDGQTGLLFTPGEWRQLAHCLRSLWDNPGICSQMGQQGWQKARREYSEDVYWQKLQTIYAYAAQRAGQNWRPSSSRPLPMAEECTR